MDISPDEQQGRPRVIYDRKGKRIEVANESVADAQNMQHEILNHIQDMVDKVIERGNKEQWNKEEIEEQLRTLIQSWKIAAEYAAQSLNTLFVTQKRLQHGENGGIYYINARGRKVYLKPSQKRDCMFGKLAGGDSNVCQSYLANNGVHQSWLGKLHGVPRPPGNRRRFFDVGAPFRSHKPRKIDHSELQELRENQIDMDSSVRQWISYTDEDV